MPRRKMLPVRIGRKGRKSHALPEASGDRTMCNRPAAGLVINEALPDCKACLRAIARAIAEMGE